MRERACCQRKAEAAGRRPNGRQAEAAQPQRMAHAGLAAPNREEVAEPPLGNRPMAEVVVHLKTLEEGAAEADPQNSA